jgi:hypothetical protein
MSTTTTDWNDAVAKVMAESGTSKEVAEEVLHESGSVVPIASPKYVVNTTFSGLLPCMSSKPLRKSTHFLHQYTSHFATLTSVLFYKEGLYIFTHHSSKH